MERFHRCVAMVCWASNAVKYNRCAWMVFTIDPQTRCSLATVDADAGFRHFLDRETNMNMKCLYSLYCESSFSCYDDLF